VLFLIEQRYLLECSRVPNGKGNGNLWIMQRLQILKGHMRTTSNHMLMQAARESSENREHSGVFDRWFSRCHRLLHFTACRVLGGPDGADLAVRNCWLTASCDPPRFDREGAFRSWLVRILIDEASAIRQGCLPRRVDYEHADLLPSHNPIQTEQSDRQNGCTL
jgi:hypothetical protein